MPSDQPLREVAFRLSPSPLLVLQMRREGGRHLLGSIIDCSESFSQLVDVGHDAIVGSHLVEYVHPDDEPLLSGSVAELLDPSRRFQVRIVRPGWGVVWVSVAAALVPDMPPEGGIVLSLDDVTAFHRAEQELARRASHDPLTGLPNRAVLMSHLTRVVARLARRPGTVAVMFVDLDGFKNLNDSFGHRFGDSMLKEVARRISLAVRRDDVVTRMGGDEFVVVCDSLETSSESAIVAERIRVALDEPFGIQGRTHALSGSVGVAQTSDPNTAPEDLLRRADLAMYRAKERGRNRVEFFVADLEERVRGRVHMIEMLRSALTEERVRLDVQPVFNLVDRTVAGHEAFARIVTTDGGTLMPGQFLEPAEQSGLIVRLDGRVISLAVAWLKETRSAGDKGWLAVNVSARLLAHAHFAETLSRNLAAADLQPDDLVIELGEAAMLDAVGPALLTLRRIRTAGFHVALDDFGTGLSSLTALRELPVDLVKIHESFVAGLGSDAADESIVTAVIRVAHDLGRKVIAEGVQTPGQADFLRGHDCDMAQGYLFGSPTRVEVAS
jgi:diguanylate cyclase (GGDEF)-like protein